jgi:hypothetical protein
MRAIRWGDNDLYFGPFTWAPSDHYRTFALTFRSRGDDDTESGQASFRLSIGRYSFLSAVPNWLVRPERTQVKAKYWSEADITRMGRDWYWQITPREYGISINDGHLSIDYGRQTHDSSTDQSWGCFLPWTQWRHVRRSFYDLDGHHFWSEVDSETDNYRRAAKLGRSDLWRERFDIVRKWEEMCPKAAFRFQDYDGQELEVTTHIEEREWRFGTGWFKWLSLFRRPKVQRSLDLRFSDEVGPEKGSWKGGTVGHSIEMRPGELHEAAFRRYCDQEHRSKSGKFRIKFAGPAALTPTERQP